MLLFVCYHVTEHDSKTGYCRNHHSVSNLPIRFIVDCRFFTRYSETMLTTKDIKQLIQAFTKVFATKADLVPLATRKDLEKFATKKALEKFATKKDIEPLASKKDLEKFATKKDLEKFATKSEMEKQHNEVVKKLDNIQSDISNLTDAVGSIFTWTDDIHKEIVSEKLPQRVRRIEKHLDLPVLAD